VQAHISQGVDPDAQDVEGRTALFFASANGHLEIVDILLASKADPTMTNAQGNTALHWACVNGHEDVVVRLLEKGAKPNVVNAGGRTALDEAMHNDRRACVDAIMKASGAHEAQEVEDVEVPGENMEEMGPDSDEDR